MYVVFEGNKYKVLCVINYTSTFENITIYPNNYVYSQYFCPLDWGDVQFGHYIVLDNSILLHKLIAGSKIRDWDLHFKSDNTKRINVVFDFLKRKGFIS